MTRSIPGATKCAVVLEWSRDAIAVDVMAAGLRGSSAIEASEAGYFAHSPLRNTGTLLPSAKMPSMSVSAEPIIQSIWIRL